MSHLRRPYPVHPRSGRTPTPSSGSFFRVARPQYLLLSQAFASVSTECQAYKMCRANPTLCSSFSSPQLRGSAARRCSAAAGGQTPPRHADRPPSVSPWAWLPPWRWLQHGRLVRLCGYRSGAGILVVVVDSRSRGRTDVEISSLAATKNIMSVFRHAGGNVVCVNRTTFLAHLGSSTARGPLLPCLCWQDFPCGTFCWHRLFY